jgi:4-hydroxy-2-oxoheptanedioate aldolase
LIEDTLAIDSLESVLETSGLDMVMPGPGDLAASLGLPGQLTHPRVAKEIARIVAIVKKRSNCYIAAYVNNAEEAISWRKSGAKLIAYSIDYKIFGAALRDIRQAMPD